MILFKEDFETQQSYEHFSTKNESFLKYHRMLVKMGIKNNTFMLTLLDPTLEHVDPHATGCLSVEMKARIARECKLNYWYYIREVLRIPAKGKPQGIPYKADRSNMAFSWIHMNSIDLFLTIPRQVGKTITTIGVGSWKIYIAGSNVTLGLFARGNKLVLENVMRLKSMRDGLPKYLIHEQSTDTNNKEGVRYDKLNNEYKTFVSQTDKRAAADQGRGESFSDEHFDEFAYYTNNHLSYSAATSATDAAAPQTRESGLPAANIITTTAGELDEARGEYAYGVACSCMTFSETLFDCKNVKELRTMVKDNSRNSMVYMEFSHTQLGKDQEWFDWVTRGKTKKEIDKDYRNMWVRGSANQVLSEGTVDKLKNGQKEPKHTQLHRTLNIKWQITLSERQSPDFKKRKLALGLDTSDNVGNDFTTLVLTDLSDIAVVATCRCNQSNLAYVAECILKLLLDYTNVIFIPERNKNGAFIIDMILSATMELPGFDPFSRIYNTIVQNLDVDANAKMFKARDFEDSKTRKAFGFNTTSGESSRGLLYGAVLTTMMEYGASNVRDAVLVKELIGLSVKNNRVDHRDGSNDDMVIAYLLTGFLALYGKNLIKYGIHTNQILCRLDSTGETVDVDVRNQQLAYREELSELETMLDSCTNSVYKTNYTRRIARLKRMIDTKSYEIRAKNVEHDVSTGKRNQNVNRMMSNAQSTALMKALIQG